MELIAERNLFFAIIQQAIDDVYLDTNRKDLKNSYRFVRASARKFLNGEDLDLICELLDLNPSCVRRSILEAYEQGQ